MLIRRIWNFAKRQLETRRTVRDMARRGAEIIFPCQGKLNNIKFTPPHLHRSRRVAEPARKVVYRFRDSNRPPTESPYLQSPLAGNHAALR